MAVVWRAAIKQRELVLFYPYFFSIKIPQKTDKETKFKPSNTSKINA